MEIWLAETEDEEKMLTSVDHYAEAWLGTKDDVCNSKTQDMRSLQNQVSRPLHLRRSISSRLSLFDVATPTCAPKPRNIDPFHSPPTTSTISVSKYHMRPATFKQEEEKIYVYRDV